MRHSVLAIKSRDGNVFQTRWLLLAMIIGAVLFEATHACGGGGGSSDDDGESDSDNESQEEENEEDEGSEEEEEGSISWRTVVFF